MYVKVKLNTGILVLFQLIMLLRAHEPKDLVSLFQLSCQVFYFLMEGVCFIPTCLSTL